MLGLPMSRRTLVFGSILVVLVGGIVAIAVRDQMEQSAREEAAREREREQRERDEAEERARVEQLVESSAAVMPEALGDLTLGMTQEALEEARSNIEPSDNTADPDRRLLEEELGNGAQVMYAIGVDSDRLERIQVLSVLPSAEAFEAHLRAMIDTYESPSGIWDCPDTGGVPTRRFTWRRGPVTLVDIFLIYGNRISVTLDIAPSETIAESLRMARCYPVTRERLDDFPTTTLQEITTTTVEGGAPARPPGPGKVLQVDQRSP